MKRRQFFKQTLTATALATLPSIHAADPSRPRQNRELYELRIYTFQSNQTTAKLDGYLKDALIPALERLHLGPVGVFTPADTVPSPIVYVLIPFPNLESFASLHLRLEADPNYAQAARDFLTAPKSQPAYDRFESWLMAAFAGMPKLEAPAYRKEPERIYELRTYESPNEDKAKKKIEMFNKGEIGIMKRLKMGPVFYGEKLVGPRMPNLTYMLSAESRDAHKTHWKGFGPDPEWAKIKDLPEYADTVSKITSIYLKPAEYSQL